jgi:hypothetical protein
MVTRASTADKRAARLSGWRRPVGIGDASVGGVEAHQGRGVRNTSEAMPLVDARVGGHDVSKSRQTAS